MKAYTQRLDEGTYAWLTEAGQVLGLSPAELVRDIVEKARVTHRAPPSTSGAPPDAVHLAAQLTRSLEHVATIAASFQAIAASVVPAATQSTSRAPQEHLAPTDNREEIQDMEHLNSTSAARGAPYEHLKSTSAVDGKPCDSETASTSRAPQESGKSTSEVLPVAKSLANPVADDLPGTRVFLRSGSGSGSGSESESGSDARSQAAQAEPARPRPKKRAPAPQEPAAALLAPQDTEPTAPAATAVVQVVGEVLSRIPHRWAMPQHVPKGHILAIQTAKYDLGTWKLVAEWLAAWPLNQGPKQSGSWTLTPGTLASRAHDFVAQARQWDVTGRGPLGYANGSPRTATAPVPQGVRPLSAGETKAGVVTNRDGERRVRPIDERSVDWNAWDAEQRDGRAAPARSAPAAPAARPQLTAEDRIAGRYYNLAGELRQLQEHDLARGAYVGEDGKVHEDSARAAAYRASKAQAPPPVPRAREG